MTELTGYYQRHNREYGFLKEEREVEAVQAGARYNGPKCILGDRRARHADTYLDGGSRLCPRPRRPIAVRGMKSCKGGSASDLTIPYVPT